MRDLFNSDSPEISVDKPIRLIELFGGYGSQSMALERIGADFEPYFLCEFDEPAVRSYNAVHGTDFKTLDIRDVHGEDLKIRETDRYFYLLTYSFPCTDLSVAGKMAGMAKGSGTRSGLLWEVERILRELHESGAELPQCLFMENVPQVTSEQNMGDFNSWRAFLQKLGYTSYLKILNAKDYGVAQNRERAFMFSFLGDVYYEFPESVPLEKRLKDYLEDEVDEKYYLKSAKAEKLIAQLMESGELNSDVAESMDKTCVDGTLVVKMTTRMSDIASTIRASYCKNGERNIIKNIIDGGGYEGVIEETMNEDLECRVVGQMDNTEDHTFESANRVYDKEGLCPTIPTGAGGGHTPKILTECASLAEKRFVDIYNKKEIKSGVCITLTAHGNASPTTCGTVAVVETGEKVVKGEIIQGGLQEHQHPRKDGISPSITAACGMGGGQTPIFTERHGTHYRIRKLTPRECGRLMGVKDSDIDKMAAVNSNTQLYKQFGNSIVVDVMCAMFRKLNISGVDSMSERYEKKEVEDD